MKPPEWPGISILLTLPAIAAGLGSVGILINKAGGIEPMPNFDIGCIVGLAITAVLFFALAAAIASLSAIKLYLAEMINRPYGGTKDERPDKVS